MGYVMALAAHKYFANRSFAEVPEQWRKNAQKDLIVPLCLKHKHNPTKVGLLETECELETFFSCDPDVVVHYYTIPHGEFMKYDSTDRTDRTKGKFPFCHDPFARK